MFEEILKEIAKEFKLIEDIIEKNPNDQKVKRIMVRSIFSGIEACASSLIDSSKPKRTMQIIEMLSENLKDDDNHKNFLEVLALNNISYRIDDRGQIRIESLKASLKNRVLFALNVLSRTHNNNINPKEIEGWTEFVEAIKIRNRVTHPKTINDLQITDTDYETVTNGLRWLIRSNHEALGGKEY